jgi:hypothetical protein
MKKITTLLFLVFLYSSITYSQTTNTLKTSYQPNLSNLGLDDDYENIELTETLYDGWDQVREITVDGYFAYAAVSMDRHHLDDFGMIIIDFSNPLFPSKVGFYDLSGTSSEGISDIKVENDLAYILTRQNGLKIVDISDPSAPVEIGNYIDSNHGFSGLYINSNFAYLPHWGGLTVLDISNPSSPIEVSNSNINFEHLIATHSHGTLVFMAGQQIIENQSSYNLHIIDVSDPNNPEDIVQYETFYPIEEMIGTDSILYVHQQRFFETSRFLVFDITTPSLPIEIDYIDFDHNLEDSIIQGDFIYFTTSVGVACIDISNPIEPYEIDMDMEYFNTRYFHNNVGATINHIFVTGHFGIKLVNVSNPLNPFEVSYNSTAGGFHLYEVSDQYALMPKPGSGLMVLDISDPLMPSEVGFITPANEYYIDMEIQDNLLFFVYRDTGIQIFDISDPLNPIDYGVYNIDGLIVHISVSNDYAYISYLPDRILILDVSDPEHISEVGLYYPITWAHYSYVHDDYLYLICYDSDSGSRYLSILDITNPENPIELGHCVIESYFVSITVNENYAYLCNSHNGISIIDISDPSSPFIAEIFDDLTGARQIVISDDIAYIIDSNPYHQYDSGLKVCDISDPLNFSELGYYYTPHLSNGVFLNGEYVYMSNRKHLMILDCSQALNVDDDNDAALPTEFSITNAYPNPFNPTLNIEISLPKTSNLTVKVFNLMGQEVAELTNRQHQAGIHNFVFDGNSGASLSSGIYFIRASAEGMFTQTQKVVLTK